jgi:hypothetical protein
MLIHASNYLKTIWSVNGPSVRFYLHNQDDKKFVFIYDMKPEICIVKKSLVFLLKISAMYDI